ncbi:MAG: MFS transporter [bacterium]|nr:MFS transporter [bacterium]
MISLYLVSFLISIHYALVAYINSSYLSNFLPNGKIGLLYTLAAALTILTIPYLPKILKKVGQFKVALFLLVTDLASILTLALVSSPIFAKTTTFPLSDGPALINNINSLTPWIPVIALSFFLIFQMSLVLNYILLDIYMEKFSKNSETGKNRGWFLTAINLAFVLSPFIVGRVITDTDDGFWKIYLLSGSFMLLSLVVFIGKLRSVKDVEHHTSPFLQTAKKVFSDKNILNIYSCNLLLAFFYSWMVIYTPIYLHSTIGFDWDQIGIIFGIMLLPFVLFQLPLGKIADKYIGEKEILTTGFVILAISTGLLTFITSKSIIVWSIALFMTRVGASAIEIMNDTYFFKKVRATDTDIIGFFRNAGPIAYVISPILASGLLYFIDYRYLFLILGIIMLLGIKFSLSIKDTL